MGTITRLITLTEAIDIIHKSVLKGLVPIYRVL
jgi:hypothetical protein